MMLSVNLYAKERRGAKLSVWKIGGQKIEGMTDSEIRVTLDKLREKDRVRDYK